MLSSYLHMTVLTCWPAFTSSCSKSTLLFQLVLRPARKGQCLQDNTTLFEQDNALRMGIMHRKR